MDAASPSKSTPQPDNEERGANETGPHPFAQFIRTIGRGPTLSRPLSRDEAAAAMGMILRGEAEPAQLGALLVLLRYRKETPAELAGFVDASHAAMARPTLADAELDWPSYADRHKQLPYFVLAAKLLAENGTRILMHGIPGDGPMTTPRALAAIGIEPSADPDDAACRLDRENFAYLPLENCCPPLMTLFAQRPVLGVRSAANTFCRMLNPFAAPSQLQGVFHPAYLPTYQEAATLLGQPFFAAFKGGGGEIQRNPDKPCRVVTLSGGDAGCDDWPALNDGGRYPWRNEPLEPSRIAALWRGEDIAAAPTAAVVGTVAVALQLLGKAESIRDADTSAQAMWAARQTTLP